MSRRRELARRMDALSDSGISRPFDRRRDGFVMGEGAGVLVLAEEEAARERGARILGYLRGYASTSDAHHLTAPEPSGRGASKAIELALIVSPDDQVRARQTRFLLAYLRDAQGKQHEAETLWSEIAPSQSGPKVAARSGL